MLELVAMSLASGLIGIVLGVFAGYNARAHEQARLEAQRKAAAYRKRVETRRAKRGASDA